MKNKLVFIGLLSILLCNSCTTTKQKDVSAMVERIPDVEKILSQMTLEEKVGQMAQVTLDVITVGENQYVSDEPLQLDKELVRKALLEYHLGSILNTANSRARTPEVWYEIISQLQQFAMEETRLGIPILYGIDAIHGATYTDGATFFPQQIGQAATWNRDLVCRAAEITAYETRASCIPWNFSPVLDMGRDPRFPRMWETFGEDAYLTSEMGVQVIKGYEGKHNEVSDPTRVASCLKHYVGYGTPLSGKDRTPALIPEIELRERHLPPFEAALGAGAHSVMINSGLVNGVPVHASYELITDMLKRELAFTGVVLTDWADISNLHKRDKVAKSQKEAVKIAINAGIDMAMIPYNFEFCDHLIELVNEGEVPMSRIDDAVRRVLNLKYKLGLFETPLTNYADYPDFGSDTFINAAYQTAQESMTLLKNEGNILPLPKDAKVLVSGPNANSMRTLNGGWTYSWQGEKVPEFTDEHSTILQAIQDKIGKNKVVFKEGVRYINEGKYWEDEAFDIPGAVNAAAQVDYVVLALGENSYTEKPGDLHDLSLSDKQLALAEALVATGKPIILILNQGRPRLIRSIEQDMQGIIQAYLPGNFGGLAVADVLFGDVNPSGKLPFTYPLYANSLLTYDHKPSEHQDKMAGMYDYESDFAIQYPFGFGLSYTDFAYEDLLLNSGELKGDDSLKISVTVKNTGNRSGKEVVQLFTSDHYATITPDVQRLRRFEKIELAPGESKTLHFSLLAADLSFINAQHKRVTESGEFTIRIGGLEQDFVYKE